MTNEKSYAIIGLGRFGMPLAKKLAEAGKEVIGIDRDEDRVKELREYTEYAFVSQTLTKDVLEETRPQGESLGSRYIIAHAPSARMK